MATPRVCDVEHPRGDSMDSQAFTPPQPPAVQAQDIQPPATTSPWQYVYMAGLIALMLFSSYSGANQQDQFAHKHGNAVFYIASVAFEFLLLLLCWIGLRIAKLKLADVIGGAWHSIEDFLLDIAIALGFWIAALLVLFVVGYALGLARPEHVAETKRLLTWIAPKTGRELALAILLASTAGLVEEIIFRGYFQQQFASLLKNVWGGVLISALLFGLSHGYQGPLRMAQIAVYGAMFGTLAVLRKSLRPGMIAHAWQDSLSLTVAFLIGRGVIPMPH